MKNLAVLASTVAVIGVAIGVAVAATATQPIAPPSGGNYGGGGYGGGYHSSTAAEGRLRGSADLVRSQGEANLSNSAAAINYSLARSNQIDNRSKATSTYFDMRETNRQARAAERGPRPSMEALVRYAQAGKPKRLSPSELDTVTGQIQWPLLLQANDFTDQRAELEGAYGRRAASSVARANDYWAIKKSTDTMLANLKTQVREVPPQDYTVAKKFLESLAYEARLPAS